MPDRALSFNTQMVEAILAGVKTQTRRPGGKPPAAEGDVICVREVHFLGQANAWDKPRTIDPRNPGQACYYRAGWSGPAPGRWRRSLYMPGWATRIFLAVTSAGMEQLRSITEEDARHEGVSPSQGGSAVEAFAALWDSIYKERGAGWDANPLVWRVTFRLTARPSGAAGPGKGQWGEYIEERTT